MPIIAENSISSAKWYKETVEKLGIKNIQVQKSIRSDLGEVVSSINVGEMYLYVYNPKLAEVLPVYDQVPLVLVFQKVPDGFYGLNLHYLPPLARLGLLESLMELRDKKNISETTRLKLRWRVLNNAVRFPGVQECVKRYLYPNIDSRILKISPLDWKKTIMLPLERFQKKSSRAVYNQSRKGMAARRVN